MQQAAALDSTFAANRAAGRIALSVAAAGEMTRRRHVYEDGPLRVRFPNSGEAGLEAVIVNTAGGIAGGDRHDLDIGVGDGATLGVTTAAADKIYRALGPDAEIAVKLSVGAQGLLAWLPQETILFDRARLRRRIEVDVANAGSVLMAEALVFGRSAMGETVKAGAFTDRWRVRRDGRLIFAETVRLDGEIASLLAEPAVTAGVTRTSSTLRVKARAAPIDSPR